MADDNGNTLTAEQIAAETARIAAATKAAEDAAAASAKATEEAAAALKNAGTTQADSDMIAKLVQERTDAKLADIKKSLDNAYAERDAHAAKIADFEKKEREANLKRLAEEGKHKEAYELQLAEERAANAALAKRNTELSRDVTVREALRSLSFRNDRAAAIAFKKITENLIQNETKQWVHRTGISVKDYCEAFSKDDEQSFLFKAKVNSGAGTTNTGSNVPASSKPQSLFEMSQAEVLQLAAEGKLPKRK